MEPKELINRYVHEVGRSLPHKLRADVQTELYSLLEEALEERAKTAGRPPDEEMAVEVLREFGEPEEVARRYGPSRYLVGPAFYPVFILVLRIVLIVLGGVFGLGLLVGLRQSNSIWADLGLTLLKMIPQFGGYALMIVGLLALIFTILERTTTAAVNAPEDWNPRDLPAVEDPDRAERVELIAGICFLGILLVTLNIFPHLVNYLFISDGEWGKIQILAPEFSVYLPWLNITWLLEIAMSLIVLKQGRWRRATRWAEFGNSILGIVVVYRMFSGGPLLTIPLAASVAKLILAIVLVIAISEAAAQLYRLLRRARVQTFRVSKTLKV